MGKLILQLNLERLQQNSAVLVPSIFTQKQLDLIQRKIKEKKLTPTEKAYFSRTISKKLEAISTLTGAENRYFFSGEELMLPERKEKAFKILKKVEKNHKNLKIILAGSFLYSKDYHDIDIFILSKYQKEDYSDRQLHFNYLRPEAVNSLFFNSLTKICLANFDLSSFKVTETVALEQIVSKYQEIMQDLSKKNQSWTKIDLRDFLIDCYYAGQKVILNSQQLKKMINSVLQNRNKEKLIQKVFVNALLLGFSPKKIRTLSQNMIHSYQNLIKVYQNKAYYQKMIHCFKEVLNAAS